VLLLRIEVGGTYRRFVLTIHRESIAVVLDMGANGLGVARSLGQQGIRVIGVDFRSTAPGLSSRYCTPLLTPDPLIHPQEALSILLDAGRKLSSKGVLYPTSDAFVLFVSRLREQLSRYFLIAIPSHEILECILNKKKLYELAESAGTPYPTARFPGTMEKVELIKDEIEYPALIKPYYSHLWWQRFRNKGFVVANPTQFVQKYKRAFDARLEAMVQEIIRGPSTNIIDVHAYLSKKHEPLATFVSRHVRKYPVDFGVGSCVESVHDERALEVGMRFFEKIHYVGIGEIELKKDVQGVYRLLDLNARTCLQSVHSMHAGVNLPLIQYQDLTDEPVARLEEYKNAVRWLDAFQDLRAFYVLTRGGQLSFRSWLTSIKKVGCHAYFARDDLKPFLRQCLNDLSEIPGYLVFRSRERSSL
jgi:D-aspartate ligase